MRYPLDKTQRTLLERTVIRARDVVEQAIKNVLNRLGIAAPEAPRYLNDDERKLRNRLRAHARQLGDELANGHQQTTRLIAEMSYEHWHRMLFARFLEQNNLLMFDQYTPLTLAECKELAEEDPAYKDEWEVAAALAQKMLPQIFRTESPVFEISISTDQRRALESLLLGLPAAVFQAQDSLGWCYQFWQSQRKDEVNKSGIKIGADELSPVTQLFTEPYMVSFLLDNSLGAWWAKRQLQDADLRTAANEQTLRDAAAIAGVPLSYLRFVKASDEQGEIWQPAGGWFDGWPQQIAELKTLDPCCGSGHFLVALFLMFVPMRMQLEQLDAKAAIDKVIKENLHGLELDSRCVEIAAFALALEAWRFPNAGGYRTLPALNIACSGLDVHAAEEEWRALAKKNPAIAEALTWLKQTFNHAPVLGSLIDVHRIDYAGKGDDNTLAPWQQLLEAKAVANEQALPAQVTAQGLAMAAKLLADNYALVATNVPYLARGKQCEQLKVFCDRYYPEARSDLATVFLERCLAFSPEQGSATIVLPQNWLFLSSYKKFREKLLKNETWNLVARLGARAFETISGEIVQAILITLSKGVAPEKALLRGLDVSAPKAAMEKAEKLLIEAVKEIEQSQQLDNPDARIALDNNTGFLLLSDYAESLVGLQTSDDPMFVAAYWEIQQFNSEIWEYLQATPEYFKSYAGQSWIVRWEEGKGLLLSLPTAYPTKGLKAVGNQGISIHRMGQIFAYHYGKERFHQNVAVVLPKNETDLPALWCFCSSPEYNEAVRQIDQALKVTNATLVKVPFDLIHWSNIAQQKYPNGLPQPYTNDPTQWIFHGHPCGSVIWDENKKWTTKAPLRTDDTVLQVAIARLLGYRWPAELDTEMELADEMRDWVDECVAMHHLVDDDGIVCLAAIRGEKTAAARLEAMLQAAYDEQWNAQVLHDLLHSVGSKSLESWLRDKFFEQHCKLFQHRPFIWQIWDGLQDGFSALVNYHKLDYKGLERLIYTYLGEWIRLQEHGIKEGIDGADIRLSAANNLKATLEAILKGDAITGQSGLDIFVRWKPLHQQPMGWNPDLNDGIRLNIRPFMQAPDMGKKGAGVLRSKPNIKWAKDRGTDVASAPWYTLGSAYGEKEGARINDHHVSLSDKKKARETACEQNR